MVVKTICLSFVYKTSFVVDANNPILNVTKAFLVLEGLGNMKSLCDMAKYTLYIGEELKMEFYLYIWKTLTHKGDTIFNVFWGTKPMYAKLVSTLDIHVNFGRLLKTFLLYFYLCFDVGFWATAWNMDLIILIWPVGLRWPPERQLS